MTFLIRVVYIFSTLLVVVGCKDQGPNAAAGSYNLLLINTFALPATDPDYGTIYSGTLDLKSGGACTLVYDAERSGTPRQVRTRPCTWTRNGASLAVNDGIGIGAHDGNLSGRQLDIMMGWYEWRFYRQ